MPVTGLRARFFAIILAVLMVVTTGSVYLYSVFLRDERLKLIDQQVRETATVLLNSELADLSKVDLEKAEEIISEELGESRIGKFFIIRNVHGETVFESASAQLLPVAEIPKDQRWFQITKNSKFIRGLNLRLPRLPDLTLQVGLLLDETLVNPSYFSRASLTFLAVIFFLGLIVSLLLTSFLLRPIARLDRFLTSVTAATRRQTVLPPVPRDVMSSPRANSRDEFERVIAGLNALIEKINKNYQFSRLWAYQMAHELKMPLARAGIEVERLQKRLKVSDADVVDIVDENRRISETINSFLSWAELENSAQQRHLFMNRLAVVVRSVVERIEKSTESSEEIRLTIHAEPMIPANPQHLEQLVLNLLQNAVFHGGGRGVSIAVWGEKLVIEDLGPGMPEDVLARIGEPFNRGQAATFGVKGHGLGLAWVISVARLYGWEVSFENMNPGTRVSLIFENSRDDDQRVIG